MVKFLSMSEIPLAEQIRSLYVDGKTPNEIASLVGCQRSYARKILNLLSTRRSMERKLEDIHREVRELRAELREALGIPRDIVLKRITGD